MAKSTTQPTSKDPTTTSTLPSDERLTTDYRSAVLSLRQFRTQWEDFLDLAYARLTTTTGFKSRVREGTLSTLLWERSTRVVAQLPTGRIQALDNKDDIGKSMLMDITWHKYIVPNANTRFSFLTKTRMWDYYSFVYGAMPAIYDYRVDDEYVGPDWDLLDPRYCFPQAGRLSPNMCHHIFVSSYQDKHWLKAKLNQKGWNNGAIRKLLSELNDDYMPDNVWKYSNLEMDRGQTIDLHKGQAEIVTKYERGKGGHWITFVPDFGDLILRDIPNPHKSGRIPIVFKYCMPLLDSIWGMGYAERGASLQKAVDTFVNMAMDFAKFKLYPPILYTEGSNMNQNRYEPAAKWKVQDINNSVGFMRVDGSYSEEFQGGYQFLKGSLLNQNHANDTTIPTNSPDNQQGKTPEAIQKQTQGENTGDNFDRNMLEESFEELANGMINLLAERQPASINFHIFDDDIKKIYDAGYTDVMEIFDSAKSPYIDPLKPDAKLDYQLNGKGAAKVTISPKRIAGRYLYMLDSGTTMQKDDQTEHDNITEVLQFAGTQEGQQVINAMQGQGKRQLDIAELFQRWIITSGIKDWEKILPEVKPTDQQQASQPQNFSPSMLQDPQMQAMYQQQQQQNIPQQLPRISLTGKLDDQALAGAERMAGLPNMQPQQHAAQQQRFIQDQPRPLVGA